LEFDLSSLAAGSNE
jgi:hypothetical protein